jgi:transposase-like protein
MRYSASEKLEIIQLVEQSSLSVRRTLAPIGIPRSTFYGWYSRYLEGGIEALEDGKPRPRRVWNKIPDEIGKAIVNLVLEEPHVEAATLAYDGSPPITRVTLPARCAHYPGGSNVCWCRLLPRSHGLPRVLAGSASARPAQASLALRPAGSLDRQKRPLSRGFGRPVARPSRSSATRSIDNSLGGTLLRW